MGARRAGAALDAGALVTVVAPSIGQELTSLAAKHESLILVSRNYQDGDLKGATLVFSCTDDPTVEREVLATAARAGVVGVGSRSEYGATATLGAIVRQGPVVAAVSTSGMAPSLTAHLRGLLERSIGSHYGDAARLMADLRRDLLEQVPDVVVRRQFWSRLLEGEFLSLLEQGAHEAAAEQAFALLAEVVERTD